VKNDLEKGRTTDKRSFEPLEKRIETLAKAQHVKGDVKQ